MESQHLSALHGKHNPLFFTHRGFKAECPDGNLGESKSITKNKIFLYALASLRPIMKID